VFSSGLFIFSYKFSTICTALFPADIGSCGMIAGIIVAKAAAARLSISMFSGVIVG